MIEFVEYALRINEAFDNVSSSVNESVYQFCRKTSGDAGR